MLSTIFSFPRLQLSGNRLLEVLCCLFLLIISLGSAHAEEPANLRCEYMANPQGVDVPKPRFFWEDRSERRGFRQTAWQIEMKQGNHGVWDSGRVPSDESIQIEYAGTPLQSATVYTWRVRIWDADGTASAWSPAATFSTGLFSPEDWTAKWIARKPETEWMESYQASRAAEKVAKEEHWHHPDSHPRDPMVWVTGHPKPYPPAPLLRKAFNVDKPVKSALLHVTGLGYYNLYLNGERIDGGALAPGMTNYNQRVLYNTYDLTKLLKPGENSIGLMLGRGWLNELVGDVWNFWKASWVAQPKAIAQMRVNFEDGTQENIQSDESWKVADGPVVFDDFRFGSVYDAGREISNWNKPGFDDASWANASVVPGPKGKLSAEVMEPIVPVTVFKADSVQQLSQTNLVEVTERISRMVSGGALSVSVNTGISGSDPAPGIPKTLRVEYQQDGQAKVVSAKEGGRLEIRGGNLSVQKAVYGDMGVGGYLYSFPQNIACQAVFRLDGRELRGKSVKFTFYTHRERNGRLSTPSGPTSSYYIPKGEAGEVVQLPEFGYAGGRYVTVEGLQKAPALEDLKLVEIRSAVEDAGEFTTSDPLLNRLHQNIRWTQANALHSYPQDCWTREKLGWTGDAHLTCEEAIYNFGMGAHYTKWMQDHLDIQAPDGGLSAYIPNHRYGNEGLTWSCSGVVVPWHLYEYYGDKRILETMRGSGAKYLNAAPTMKGKANIYFGGPGEWCVPWAQTVDQIQTRDPAMAVPISTFPGGGEGHYVYGTAYFYRLAGMLQEIAGLLGDPEEAKQWRERKEKVKKAFTAEFFEQKTMSYHGENRTDYRQAANILPLGFNMVPEQNRPEVLANLVGDIVARKEGHLNMAVIGTQALFEALPKLGLTDLAYEIAMQKTYPGYLWPLLTFGLTTITENWEGGGTHEHPFFGSVDAFFYKWIGGIQPDASAPGFKHFFIRPSVDNPLQFAKASYRSVRGLIRSEWRKQGADLMMEVEIPANTEADVAVPKFGYAQPQIAEGAETLWGALRSASAVEEAHAVVFRLPGGVYRFKVSSSEPLAVARKAGIDFETENAIVYSGETGVMTVKATGNIPRDAELAVSEKGGVKVREVKPHGPGVWKVTLATGEAQPAWRAEPVQVSLRGKVEGKAFEVARAIRVAVRVPMEVRYPVSQINVAQNYESPQPLFYLYSRRDGVAQFALKPKIPSGCSAKFFLEGREIAPGERFGLQPKVFSKVEVSFQLERGFSEGQPLAVAVVEGGKEVGGFECPVRLTQGQITDSFYDDFRAIRWQPEGALQIKPKGEHVELLASKGHVEGMVSDWMVMDCSRPFVVTVNISALSGGKWCLQMDDGITIRYLISENASVGIKQGKFAKLNMRGPRRFRLKLITISEQADCRLTVDKISISEKTSCNQ